MRRQQRFQTLPPLLAAVIYDSDSTPVKCSAPTTKSPTRGEGTRGGRRVAKQQQQRSGSEEEKMSDEGKKHHHHHHHHHHPDPSAPPPPPQYGTFQGEPGYPPPQPAMGFPQPVAPPGAISPSAAAPTYYAHGYQGVPAVEGYAAVAEGRPVREPRLRCCGCGMGWFLFIIGFFLAAIPWYVGAFILACTRVDHREKPGYVACTIAGVLAVIAIIIGATKGTHAW